MKWYCVLLWTFLIVIFLPIFRKSLWWKVSQSLARHFCAARCSLRRSHGVFNRPVGSQWLWEGNLEASEVGQHFLWTLLVLKKISWVRLFLIVRDNISLYLIWRLFLIRNVLVACEICLKFGFLICSVLEVLD